MKTRCPHCEKIVEWILCFGENSMWIVESGCYKNDYIHFINEKWINYFRAYNVRFDICENCGETIS